MANNENAFQIALVKEAQRLGGNALRVRHYSLAGIPDLYVKLRGIQSCWIECKFIRNKPKPPKLTPLQLAWINKELKAKGNAGWAMCVRVRSGLWDIYVGIDDEFDTAQNYLCRRQTGESWPIKEITFRIIDQSMGRRL